MRRRIVGRLGLRCVLLRRVVARRRSIRLRRRGIGLDRRPVTPAAAAETVETEMAAHAGVKAQNGGACTGAEDRKARAATVARSLDFVLIDRRALPGIGVGGGRQIAAIGLGVGL